MARRRESPAGAVALPRAFYARDVLEVARDLLGMVLLKDGVGGPIVEAEAYDEREASCHAARGRTRRNASMFLPGGHVYVYRVHTAVCLNVVTGPEGRASAVLVRALLPTDGARTIAARRRGRPAASWTDGPGKVCAALGVTLEDDGHDLLAGRRLTIVDRGIRYRDADVRRGPRIGISKATELPWRFLVATAER